MRLRSIALLASAAAALAISGGVLSATLPSNVASVCATTPAQTLADNGSPIYTIPASSACVTVTGPTATVTTTAPTTTDTTTSSPPGYLFNDEFNGPAGAKPSSTLWGAKTSTAGSGTVWDGFTRAIEDGSGDLVVTATKVAGAWHSAFISSKTSYTGPHDVTVRAKVACGAGTWSAPAWEWQYPYGANAVEDDVAEQLGREPAIYHTTLHADTSTQAGYAAPANAPLCDAFHVYEAKIYSDHADYYLDGVLVHTITPANLGGKWPFTTTPLCLNIDLNMGGWGGTIGITGPVSMLVDYVRVKG